MVEELWLPPRGGLMLGLNRTVSGPKSRAQFEYFRIEQSGDSIVLFASPSGKAPTPFELLDVSEEHVVFANPEHDFPQRLTYGLDESGKALNVRAEGEGAKTLEWRWRRGE